MTVVAGQQHHEAYRVMGPPPHLFLMPGIRGGRISMGGVVEGVQGVLGCAAAVRQLPADGGAGGAGPG